MFLMCTFARWMAAREKGARRRLDGRAMGGAQIASGAQLSFCMERNFYEPRRDRRIGDLSTLATHDIKEIFVYCFRSYYFIII